MYRSYLLVQFGSRIGFFSTLNIKTAECYG